MSSVSLVCLVDQPPIENCLRYAGLVTRNQQHSALLRVDRVSDAPNALIRTETQFLHVAILRSLQRVGVGAAQIWPKLLQNVGARQKLFLNYLRQLCELGKKVVVEQDDP